MRCPSVILCFLCVFAGSAQAADTVAVLPLFNVNQNKSPNLDWIGESVAETVRESLSSSNILVLGREDREEVFRRLSIRPEAMLTRASVIKIGETLDASQVVFGEFQVQGAEYGATNLKSNLRLTAHIIDLKRFHEGSVAEQTGPLDSLSQMETKLAFLLLKQLQPRLTSTEADFLRDRPPVRVDAMESYIRGLISSNPELKQKLFAQAAKLDDHFSQPNFQLGRMLFIKKDYKTAGLWLARVSKTDSHYLEASYRLGICRYHVGDYDGAIKLFRLVAAEVPLNEVYNDLGAALSRKNDLSALDNFRKALEGDQADPDYWFNVGYVMWKAGQFAQAAEKFRAVLDRSANDTEATAMLGRCIKMDGPRAGDPRSEGRERLKTAFEDSAFRQLQAELQSKK